MPKPPKQLCPAEGKKTAVQVAGHLVQIGKRHHEGDRLALHFRNADQILEDERLQLLARIGDLGVGQRDVAPVVGQGIVQDREDQFSFLVEEIGRGSGRGRGSDYVLVSVVAVELKKKNN